MTKKKNPKSTVKQKSFFAKVLYFFPLQLLFVHLKKNQQLLIFWLLLFLAIYEKIGLKYGIPYLFVAPEYLGHLSFSSYFIVGFALGGFAMAFNISSYIMNGFRFPFLATLSKPFLKYAINNSVIPLSFIISYLLLTFDFLNENENFSQAEIIYRLAGFCMGYFIFISTSMGYFLATNKSFEKLFGKELSKILRSPKGHDEPATVLLNKKETPWYKKKSSQKYWRVESYLNARFIPKLTRPYQHYDESMLSQVFRQNHLNASRFELVVIFSIIVLGIFRENEIFMIPAGATIILLFTMLLMITSAIRSWIQGWTFPLLIALFLIINQLSSYNKLYYQNRAYGLSYEKTVSYPLKETTKSTENLKEDKKQTIKMLNHWLAKNEKTKKKPKAIFFAASGGGSRAALWSFLALRHLDSVTDGQLMEHSIMGTGSSGGMLGAAYFRELKLQSLQAETNPYHEQYKMDLGKDMLNPVIFNLAVNDALIRTKRFEYDGEKHWKDRAYVFEETLFNNCKGLLDKKLGDYYQAESKALVPSLIFTPSVVNDGRRMLVSTLPLSFMCESNKEKISENFDFLSFFKDNSPLNTRFSSVLRMNSSFPYVMPTVNLPTDPSIAVFDSGLRDNYGIKTLLSYIFQIRSWLEKNTSGIIILQIRDGLKVNGRSSKIKKQSIVNEILSPFGSLYGNWFEVQDYNNEELLKYSKSWFNGEVEVINYQLNKNEENYISLSWHLTAKEKQQIVNSLTLAENKQAEKRLAEILNQNDQP